MLRLCKLPSKDGVNNEYGWFDRESGRALTESEVLSMDGTEYRWTAHYADGTTEEAVATFTPGASLPSFSTGSPSSAIRRRGVPSSSSSSASPTGVLRKTGRNARSCAYFWNCSKTRPRTGSGLSQRWRGTGSPGRERVCRLSRRSTASR